MKKRKIKLISRIKALVLSLALSASMLPMGVSAAEPNPELLETSNPVFVISQVDENTDITELINARAGTTFVNIAQEIGPKQTITGTLTLTNLFGTNFKIIGAASNTGGSLEFGFVSQID